MKLLLATSFFFLALLFLFSNCKSEKKLDQQNFSLLTVLKDSTYEKSINGQRDSAIYYAHKLLKASLKENNDIFILDTYERLSKLYFSQEKYDTAIFYSHKFLKMSLDKGDVSSIKVGYNKLAYYHSKSKISDSALYFYDKLVALAAQTNDTLWMAKASSKKGFYYKGIDSFPSAYKNFERSKNLYLEMGDSIEAGKKSLEIANILKTEGNFGASQLSALEGLGYLEKTNELKSLSGLYFALAVASKETGRLKVAEQRLHQALALVKDSASLRRITVANIRKFKNTKANIFKELKQYDEAISIYEKLLIDEKNDTLETKRVNANLAHTLFLKYGFNKKSDSLLQNARSYFSSTQETSALFSVQLKLAQLYSEFDQEKSLEYVNDALKNAEESGNQKSIFEALEIRIDQKSQPEDFTKYVKIRKQIEASKENLSYLYANERFDFDKSNKARIASEKAKTKAETKATQKEKENLVLLLILLIVLVLVYFIYQKIKRRHKIEKVKTVQDTEVRIATKVHDELANDIHNLMAKLETSEPNKENVLDKLDVIYNNARDISKQNSSVETGKGFTEELSNLFRSYESDEVNVILKKYDTDIWKGISAHIKITIYRVLQELLTNTKKHSNAALIMVSIEKKNKQLSIQYTDNGKGFDEEISKNGLLNAENRIHGIKGTLIFDTELHKGCKFSINVPV